VAKLPLAESFLIRMSFIFSVSAPAGVHDLRADWRARLQASPQRHVGTCYTVLQTGFDDCRQFLHTWAAWQQQDADHAVADCLHYLIVGPQQMLRRPLPDTDSLLAQQLDAAWPPMTPGYHRLLLAQERVVLTLIIGEVTPVLAQLDAAVDCFLLQDAASWSAAQVPALLQRLARLAAPQAQLHMVSPVDAPALSQAGFKETATAWQFAPRWSLPAIATASVPAQRHAIVVGAGLAGSAACQRLAARGWRITLLEQHGQAAQEASGNLAGVYMPAISRDDNPTARLSRSAFLFAQQLWRQLGMLEPARGIGKACGVLQLARDADQAQAFEDAAQHWQYPADYAQWLSADASTALLGMTAGSGWLFPAGGWLRPAAVCEALLQACGTQLQRCFHQQAASLRHVDENWLVHDADGALLAQAPVLILANGMQALRFEQAASFPLQAIRGQVSHVPAMQLPALPVALCGDGYLTGAVNGLVCMGASYDQDDDANLRLDSHRGNLTKLRQMLPQWQTELDPASWNGRVGFRCVAADRLPLVGSLPDLATLATAGEVQLRNLPRHAQLFGLLGYASRGLIWAPLAAEIIACQLNGEPAPLGKDALALLDPARFALKAHRRS
jgi:tRNA 5-methylaminomethyl-2-thiouridine biosynthesis bifunctional protein